MAYEFTFPDLGEGITEGELVEWKVKEGDVVAEDQTLAEIETDNALVEVPSPRAGRIERLHAAEGDILKVGSVIVTIEEGVAAAVPAAAPAAAEAAAVPVSAAVPAAVPTAAAVPAEPAVEFCLCISHQRNTCGLIWHARDGLLG